MSNSPYHYQPDDAPKSRRRSGGGGGGSNKTLKIVLIVVGVLTVLCAGAGVTAVIVIRSFAAQGFAIMTGAAVESSPEAKEAIGEIQSASLNTTVSAQSGDGGVVFDVHGTKSDGRVILNSEHGTGSLEMPDGKSIPLTVQKR